MARFEHVQTNFTAGEITPNIRGRIDFENFFNGVSELTNYVVQPHGGIARRPGTRFVNEVKDSADFTRLFPFQFSLEEAYVIEAGDLYFRFYKDEGLIEDGIAIDAVDQGTDVFTITGDHTVTIQVGDTVTVDGSTGNDGTYTVFSVGDNGSDTDVGVNEEIPDATADGEMVIPVEVITPYLSADLPFINFTQSADVMFIVSPDYGPNELRRTSDTEWDLVAFDFQDGPYQDLNIEATTLTPSATTGNITITASAVTGINDDQGFLSTDVGRLVRIDNGAVWGNAEITAVNSTTEVDAAVNDPFSATTATADWRLGAWSDTTGWPRAVTFFQERLWFAGTDTEPQTVWSSNTSDFDNFAPSDLDGTVADEHAITITLSSNQVNAVLWLENTSQGLMAGTSASEAVIRPPSTSTGISPTNKEVRFQTNVGSDEASFPVSIGHSILFVQRGGTVINEALFDFDLDGFSVRDASILAEHLLRSGATDLAYQQNPDKIVWMDNFDGRLVGLSFEKDQKVFGWHKHILGGAFNGGEPVVESITIMPEDVVDQPWLIVKRTVNGSTKRYIEFVENHFDTTVEVLEDAFYVDSGLTGEEVTATDTWAGLDHLEGQTVTALVDGSAHPDVVVEGGEVVLDRTANVVQIGLPYTSRVTTVPIESGELGSTTVGKLKRAPRMFIRFIDTVGAKVAQTGSTLDLIPFGPGPMNQPPALFTGTKEAVLSGSRDYDLQVTVEQTQPFPSTIVNIVIIMEFA